MKYKVTARQTAEDAAARLFYIDIKVSDKESATLKLSEDLINHIAETARCPVTLFVTHADYLTEDQQATITKTVLDMIEANRFNLIRRKEQL